MPSIFGGGIDILQQVTIFYFLFCMTISCNFDVAAVAYVCSKFVHVHPIECLRGSRLADGGGTEAQKVQTLVEKILLSCSSPQ